MRRVLLAIDDSGDAAHLAEVAAHLFDAATTEFVTVTVRVPPPPLLVGDPMIGVVPTSVEVEATGLTAPEAASITDHAGIASTNVVVGVGEPVEEICKVAEKHDVDVIVVGDHHKRFLSRLIDPPTSASVIRHTHRPVLVVPPPA